jgi:hypothetical protein
MQFQEFFHLLRAMDHIPDRPTPIINPQKNKINKRSTQKQSRKKTGKEKGRTI